MRNRDGPIWLHSDCLNTRPELIRDFQRKENVMIDKMMKTHEIQESLAESQRVENEEKKESESIANVQNKESSRKRQICFKNTVSMRVYDPADGLANHPFETRKELLNDIVYVVSGGDAVESTVSGIDAVCSDSSSVIDDTEDDNGGSKLPQPNIVFSGSRKYWNKIINDHLKK